MRLSLLAVVLLPSYVWAGPVNSADGVFSLELPALWQSTDSHDRYVLWVNDASEGGTPHRFSVQVSSGYASPLATAREDHAQNVHWKVPDSGVEEVDLGMAEPAYKVISTNKNGGKIVSLYFAQGQKVYLAIYHESVRERVQTILRSIGPPREFLPPPKPPQAVMKLPGGRNVLISTSLCEALEQGRARIDGYILILCWALVGFVVLALALPGAIFVPAFANTFFLVPLALGVAVPHVRNRWHALGLFAIMILCASITPEQMSSAQNSHLCARMIYGWLNGGASLIALAIGLALRDAYEKRRR